MPTNSGVKPEVALSWLFFRTGLLWAIALVLLVFGLVTSICSQPVPERVLYGLLPIALGVWAGCRAARRCLCSISRQGYAWLAIAVVAIASGVSDFVAYQQLYRALGEWNWSKVAWDKPSSTLDWGRGRVSLPAGFQHDALYGIDTQVGDIRSADGAILVRYDIGELAGEHGALGRFAESLRDGSRIRMSVHASGEEEFAAVSFPDAGCANFFTSSPGGASVIDSIARSFQPRNRLPGWLVPILPLRFRSDCRYRCRTRDSIW